MNHLRPDEKAAQSEISRYKENKETIKKGAKTALNIGLSATGLGAGGKLASKILPFLSEFIPPELAMKGINKFSPKLGKFLDQGMKMGLDVKEGLNFIKGKMQPSKESATEQPKENRNIIEQYSPALNQFMMQQIQSGRSPIEAGALAENDKKYSDVIKKMKKDHKSDWSSIIQSIFGTGQTAQPQQSQSSLQGQNQQPQGQQGQQGQQQIGAGQQALMAMLDKINQRLGQ